MTASPAPSAPTSVPTAHVPTEGLVNPDVVPVRRALISVYDKTGLIELATALAAAGIEIVSTGSTAATIAAAGIAVVGTQCHGLYADRLAKAMQDRHYAGEGRTSMAEAPKAADWVVLACGAVAFVAALVWG